MVSISTYVVISSFENVLSDLRRTIVNLDNLADKICPQSPHFGILRVEQDLYRVENSISDQRVYKVILFWRLQMLRVDEKL